MSVRKVCEVASSAVSRASSAEGLSHYDSTKYRSQSTAISEVSPQVPRSPEPFRRRGHEGEYMRKLIVVLAVLAVTASGAAVSSRAGAAVTAASPAARTATASIKWGACSDSSLRQLHAQCGFLKVPLDYSKPDGAKISLAVSRILHTSPASQYQGVILTNPGRPGRLRLDRLRPPRRRLQRARAELHA